MKVLFLTDSDPDYGVDYLYDGFVKVCDEVVDYPSKSSLHLAPFEDQKFDCDQLHPPSGRAVEYVVDTLADRGFDCIVVPGLRRGVCASIVQLRGLLSKNADRLCYYDAEDHRLDTTGHVEALLGCRVATSFKRELPFGAEWAEPLGFGYPLERVVGRGGGWHPGVDAPERSGGVYMAQLWSEHEKRRRAYAAALMAAFPNDVTVRASCVASERLSIADYHATNHRALFAISPAGAGWWTNRHLEIVADGCCPVIEYPTVQWSDAFEAGTEAIYFRDVDELVKHVRFLLNEPEATQAIAERAQRALLSRHTTAHRAMAVLNWWGKRDHH